MGDNDPITQFFPGEEEIDLYAVISLQKGASLDSIKKAYRKLALVYHPDKHANATEKTKEEALIKFQQIGFAYAVLSDLKRKTRYDSTGKTDEGFDLCAGEDGWQTYFEELFDRVTRGKLDEMKREYQGSAEEVEDLKEAYNSTSGDLVEIMTHIPHSAHEDEPRFITIITDLIKGKKLKSTPSWMLTSRDEKAKMIRKAEAEKEAREAEELAKELGVWDEFYGSGKATDQEKRKNKGKAKNDDVEAEEDHSVLQALILKKKEKNMESFFDDLAAKYSETASKKGRGRKRGHCGEEDESPNKKTRPHIPPPPELDDEEFAKIQKRLFADKGSSATKTEKKGNRRKVK